MYAEINVHLKKNLTIICFLLSFILAIGTILSHLDRLDTSIYSLLPIKSSDTFKKLEQNLSNDIIFLFKDIEAKDDIKLLNGKYDCFEDIESISNKADSMQLLLERYKLVTLNRDSLKLLSDNYTTFFEERLQEIFNSFNKNIVSLDKDLFSLSSLSTLISNNNSFNYDLTNDILYKIVDDELYYFQPATLKNGYKPLKLIALHEFLKDKYGDRIIISGGALFNAYGFKEGITESIVMTSLAVGLNILILLLAFKNRRAIFLMGAILFSLPIGISVCLLYGSLHILAVVISASLVGMVLDFPLHFLAKNEGVTLKSSSILKVKKVLILNLIITSSGYLLFFFSGMVLLKEIALISIGTLAASCLYTYFLLPTLLEGKVYSRSTISQKAFNRLLTFFQMLYKGRLFLIILSLLLICYGFYNAANKELRDNIKTYSSVSKSLLDDSIKASELTGFDKSFKYIYLDNYSIEREYALVTALLDRKAIKSYNGISSFLLTNKEFEKAKNALFKASTDSSIISTFVEAGLDRQLVESSFKSLLNAKYPTLLEVTNDIEPLQKFAQADGSGIIFITVDSLESLEEVLKDYNEAKFYSFVDIINSFFTHVKKEAAILKIIGLLLALIILFIVLKRGAFKVMAVVISSTLITLAILSSLNLNLNIFVIFGLILASAISIDYAIFMNYSNDNSGVSSSLYGIIIACLTSTASFLTLAFSKTDAVFSFGISVSIAIIITLLILGIIAAKKHAN